MRLSLTVIAAASALLAKEQSLLRSWSKQLDQSTKTPIQRVVLLLKNMQVEIEKEKAKDAELFEKMECWCKTNEKEKKHAVDTAEQKIGALEGEINERAAKTAQLDAEVKQLKKEVASAIAALDEATRIREKAREAFRGEDREAQQAVVNLKNAITVLAKHHKGLLQLTPELKQAVDSVLREAADKRELLQIQGKVGASKPAAALLQTEASAEASLVLRGLRGNAAAAALAPKYASRVLSSLVQGPSELEGYTSQSGQIFGILQSMLEEFQSTMATGAEDEAKAEAEFKKLKAAKEAEIAAGEKSAREKTAQSAKNAKALADAKEDLTETRAQRSADVEFLRNLKLQCQQTDKDYEQRLESRNAEIAAVADALTILTEDDNREQLVKSGAFVQVKSESARRMAAVQLLRRAAQKSAEPKFDDLEKLWSSRTATAPKTALATLAVTASLDSFGRVKEAMDQMIAELTKQQQDEVEHRDYCVEEFNGNDKEKFDKEDVKGDLERSIAELENTIQTLNTEIAEHKAEIAETQLAIKAAGEGREKENAEFQTTVADQRATQEILNKVVTRLGQFYKKKAALMQQEPPVKFGEYKSNQGSSSVLSLLDKIIEDSKAVENESIDAEKAAQAEYEQLVADSNQAIKDNQRAIAQKSESAATAAADKSAAEADLQKTQNALDTLAQYRADLHQSCDFVMKNFEIRQTARREEMDAIRQAKAILSGAQ